MSELYELAAGQHCWAVADHAGACVSVPIVTFPVSYLFLSISSNQPQTFACT